MYFSLTISSQQMEYVTSLHHCLRIETERYKVNRLDRNDRLFTFCNARDIEDEYHFVLVCKLYRITRENI
jgi:hypothetical protein